MKKTKKYVVVRDADGDIVVWALHADLTFTPTSLRESDIGASSVPVVDLRYYGEELKETEVRRAEA